MYYITIGWSCPLKSTYWNRTSIDIPDLRLHFDLLPTLGVHGEQVHGQPGRWKWLKWLKWLIRNRNYLGMDQYLLIPFLGGWTSINPSYFDVNYRGTIGFDTLPYVLGMLKLAKAFDFYMLLFASSWRQYFFQWIWGWLKTKTVPLVLCCSPQVIAGIYGCE